MFQFHHHQEQRLCVLSLQTQKTGQLLTLRQSSDTQRKAERSTASRHQWEADPASSVHRQAFVFTCQHLRSGCILRSSWPAAFAIACAGQSLCWSKLVLVKACGVWVSLSEANPLSKSGAFLKKLQKVPFVAQQERISLASMRTWVRSPASLSG